MPRPVQASARPTDDRGTVLRLSPERDAAYRAIAARLPDMLVVVFDAELRVRVLEGGGAAAVPHAARVAAGGAVGDLVEPAARPMIEARHRAALAGATTEFGYACTLTGREYRITVGPLDEGDGEQLGLAVWHDVTERNRSERRLQHIADHDGLTGLLNRRRFEQEVERHLALTRRYGPAGAVLFIDLDHFKYVNDTLGHAAGDDLIVLVADVLRQRLRSSDVLARLGGDEFAVLLPQVDEAGAATVADALVADLRGHVRDHAEDRLRPVTASIGVALVTGREESVDELLTNADLAMYDAKEAGRDRSAIFHTGDDGGDEPAIRARVRWLDRIQEALETDAFVLHGQPIVDLRTGATVGHEVLLRMTDADGGIIPPNAFLPIAERFGMVQAIDRWVIAHAVQLVREHGGPLSVNLSGRSLSDPALMEHIAAHVRAARIDPRRLTFEITETAAVTNVGLARRFAEGLHDLGCRLSLDDFGAGFGSFYYLKHLPFDVVKIDGEFVSGCTANRTDQLVIDAVVRMAAGLSKETVGEFTGDRETAEFLRRAGVMYGQGYYLGRPVPLTGALTSDRRPGVSTSA